MPLPVPFTFSQSSLQDYADCPRRFQLRYIDQLAWPAVETEPVAENERRQQEGQLFHRLAQQHLLGLPAENLARLANTPNLERWWLAARVDGRVQDLARALPDGATVELLTDKHPQALDVLRHSAAHVLATAVRQLFPHARIGFGPPIEDGFYYDFEVPAPFTPEDLEAIEKRMVEVVKADYPFVREEVSRADAKRRFTDDPLKLERI